MGKCKLCVWYIRQIGRFVERLQSDEAGDASFMVEHLVKNYKRHGREIHDNEPNVSVLLSTPGDEPPF